MQEFLKVEGLGNDFLLVDERSSNLDTVQLPLDVRQALCVRQNGVGADGVLTLLRPRSKDAFCRLHITNSDGSVPQMCGNGLRCVVAALVAAGDLALETRIKIETDAGDLEVCAEDAQAIVAEVGPATIGPAAEEIVIAASAGEGITVRGQRVSVGNPHFILDDVRADESVARALGPQVECHPAFAERTNVEFVDVQGDTVKLVVWERGVGLTQACGTGACATVAALANAGRVPKNTFVVVQLPGGPLEVKADFEGAQTVNGNLSPRVWMKGPARVVFRGSFRPSDFAAG